MVKMAIAIVLVLVGLAAWSVWRERASAKSRAARRRQRRLKTAGYDRAWSWVYGRNRTKRLTYQPVDPDETD